MMEITRGLFLPFSTFEQQTGAGPSSVQPAHLPTVRLPDRTGSNSMGLFPETPGRRKRRAEWDFCGVIEFLCVFGKGWVQKNTARPQIPSLNSSEAQQVLCRVWQGNKENLGLFPNSNTAE